MSFGDDTKMIKTPDHLFFLEPLLNVFIDFL